MKGVQGKFGSGQWRSVVFGDFAEVQPKVALEKGATYSFIEMAAVEPHIKFVHPNNTRVWNGSGGAKFEDGDVLFARITPCLEHGKTVKVGGLTDARGFGSSEFFVFRGREDISDPDFIYYLSRTPAIREPAIKSMIGASGRQRAQKTVVENTTVHVPGIEEQRRIASVLSAYDNLIENNRRRIQLLEQSARLLYKEWFVHLRFPDHAHVAITNGVPAGWKTEKVSAHIDFVRGVEPGSKNYTQVSDERHVPFLRVGDFGSRTSKIFIDASFAKGNMLNPEDVAITMDGTPGLVGFGMTGAFSSGIRKVVPRDSGIGWSFIYALLKSESIQSTVAKFAKGTTILHASSSIDHMVFLQPPKETLAAFESTAGPLLRQVLLLEQQNRKLVKSRDLLLPRLMSGAL